MKLLNSNTKNPYIVWDNGTRAELAEFLENERVSIVRRGTCDPAFGAEFKYSAHKDELVVGNIFVRIYNEQPEFQLEVKIKIISFHTHIGENLNHSEVGANPNLYGWGYYNHNFSDSVVGT